jgi:hypothetical protein
LSSLSNKTILYNEKLFKIIGSIILILIIAVVVFLYFVSTPLPGRTTRSKSRSTYRQIQAAINQTAWDSTAAVSFSFREITIISGTKNAT